jgi:hypothetical protein
MLRLATTVALCALVFTPRVEAQQPDSLPRLVIKDKPDSRPRLVIAAQEGAALVPFGPGEKVTYGVSWGIFGRRGTASSEVVSVDTVRGQPSYHLSFSLRGKVIAFSINDTQESWLDVTQLYSHRFKQNLNQTSYKRLRTLDFFPDEMKWRRVESPDSGELASEIPLDDVSFLYWARTLDLEVGQRYEFHRYFKDSGNPVIIEVLRKERVTVPAGTFNTIVVRPLIRTSGLFSEGGSAEIYFSDDTERIVVMLKTKLSVGTATLRLESYTPGEQLAGVNRPRP